MTKKGNKKKNLANDKKKYFEKGGMYSVIMV